MAGMGRKLPLALMEGMGGNRTLRQAVWREHDRGRANHCEEPNEPDGHLETLRVYGTLDPKMVHVRLAIFMGAKGISHETERDSAEDESG
jgi:hypothetical protein